MANECLVTKLKGVVDNENLPKFGHFYINVPAGSINDELGARLSYRPVVAPITIAIIGDGYFTDNTWTTNLGKSLEINTSIQSTNLYIYSVGGCKVDIPDNYKGARCSLSIKHGETLGDGIQYRLSNYADGINGDVMDGVDVDITDGYKIEQLIGLVGKGVHGDLTNSLNLSPTKNLIRTRLRKLVTISEKGITFNAAVFKADQGVGLYGGIENKYLPLYWESDPTNDTIPGVIFVDFGNYLDTALIDMAGRSGMTPVNPADMQIIVRGAKSALSDAAVATLKQKGFAVTINDVPQ